MYPNRQKINDVDAGRARRHPSGPTGLWRVPGAHVDAVGGSRGALEWGAEVYFLHEELDGTTQTLTNT